MEKSHFQEHLNGRDAVVEFVSRRCVVCEEQMICFLKFDSVELFGESLTVTYLMGKTFFFLIRLFSITLKGLQMNGFLHAIII